jgi:hypothetical protein
MGSFAGMSVPGEGPVAKSPMGPSRKCPRPAQSRSLQCARRVSVHALWAPVALAELPPLLLIEEGFELLDPGGAKGNNTRVPPENSIPSEIGHPPGYVDS